MLIVHPDLLWNASLTKKIRQFEFFNYSVNEALFLSEKEEIKLTHIVHNIEREYHNNLDKFSHDIMITQLESLLSYSERFYQRQFMTRRIVNHQLLGRIQDLLSGYFDSADILQQGLPSVNYLAAATARFS